VSLLRFLEFSHKLRQLGKVPSFDILCGGHLAETRGNLDTLWCLQLIDLFAHVCEFEQLALELLLFLCQQVFKLLLDLLNAVCTLVKVFVNATFGNEKLLVASLVSVESCPPVAQRLIEVWH
jgi:hypothetical protein